MTLFSVRIFGRRCMYVLIINGSDFMQSLINYTIHSDFSSYWLIGAQAFLYGIAHVLCIIILNDPN